MCNMLMNFLILSVRCISENKVIGDLKLLLENFMDTKLHHAFLRKYADMEYET